MRDEDIIFSSGGVILSKAPKQFIAGCFSQGKPFDVGQARRFSEEMQVRLAIRHEVEVLYICS